MGDMKRSGTSKRRVFGIFAILGVTALLINLSIPPHVLADDDDKKATTMKTATSKKGIPSEPGLESPDLVPRVP